MFLEPLLQLTYPPLFRSSPAGGDFAGRTAEETAWDIQDAEITAAAASGVDSVSEYVFGHLIKQL